MTNPSTKYVGRFAPSPTGPLHVGSLVACLASYLDARSHGGKWLVRMEDVDTTRCNPEFAEVILKSLSAFGFDWDGEVLFQRRRSPRYRAALDQLTADKLTYACACSRKEIADSALVGIEGPAYPGTCRNKALAATGNAMRVRTNPAQISFCDRVQGEQCQQIENAIGDFVLLRRDGLFAYQLAVVVDDADQGVNHVVRGADLLDSTARQIYLQRLLDFPIPEYLHIPVLTNSAGQKLSKQTLAPAIAADKACQLLRAALSFLGQAIPGPEYASPQALLTAAARAWNADAIPKRPSRHIL